MERDRERGCVWREIERGGVYGERVCMKRDRERGCVC